MVEQDLPDSLQNRGSRFVQNAEMQGARWTGLSETALVEMVGTSGNSMDRDGALAELQRCHVRATREFNEQFSVQADRMLRLTRWIIGLTIGLAVIAVVQLFALFGG